MNYLSFTGVNVKNVISVCLIPYFPVRCSFSIPQYSNALFFSYNFYIRLEYNFNCCSSCSCCYCIVSRQLIANKRWSNQFHNKSKTIAMINKSTTNSHTLRSETRIPWEKNLTYKQIPLVYIYIDIILNFFSLFVLMQLSIVIENIVYKVRNIFIQDQWYLVSFVVTQVLRWN